jgi:hypothetical protein
MDSQSVLRERFTLTAGSLLCVFITLWFSRMLGIPADPMRAGTLLQQSAWPIAIGLTWILLIGGTLLTCVFASNRHYEAGLFCSSLGVAILSVQFGPERFALFAAGGPHVYLSMCLELILLYIGIAIAWSVLHRASRVGLLPAEPAVKMDEPLDQKLLAMLMHVIVMTVVMLLLCRSDVKPQTFASVAVAAYLASLAAYQFVPTQPSAWFLASPLIVGLIGYIAQYFSPWDWMIGDARGYFANLSCPLPLDYATLGTAGALLGYWTAQRWHQNAPVTETVA